MRSLRTHAQASGLAQENHFRWRGNEVSRIEGLSDAVFGFAITLLVVSLEVPESFDQLLATMRAFPAFGICFTMLVLIWHAHYVFFRRYGLQDSCVIVLNSVLLFVILFYIYPLKFVFSMLMDRIFGAHGGWVVSIGQMRSLMVVYSLGFLAVFTIFLLLYVHAYRQRRQLELSPAEVFDTCTSLQQHGIYIAVAVLSIAIAVFGNASALFWSGLAYFLLGPSFYLHGARRSRQRQKLLASPDGGETRG